jgi:hypothetical protein
MNLDEVVLELVDRDGGHVAHALNSDRGVRHIAASCSSFHPRARSLCRFAECASAAVEEAITRRDCPAVRNSVKPLRSVRFAAHGLDRTAAPPVSWQLRDGLPN